MVHLQPKIDAKIRSKRRIVGIGSDDIDNATNLLLLLLTTKTTATAVLLVIGIVRETLAVVMKQWTPLIFSCRILLLMKVVAASQQRVMKLP